MCLHVLCELQVVFTSPFLQKEIHAYILQTEGARAAESFLGVIQQHGGVGPPPPGAVRGSAGSPAPPLGASRGPVGGPAPAPAVRGPARNPAPAPVVPGVQPPEVQVPLKPVQSDRVLDHLLRAGGKSDCSAVTALVRGVQ